MKTVNESVKLEVMNKIELAVVRYESARVLVNELDEKRSQLVSECEFYNLIDNEGDIINTVLPCSVVAWECMREINEQAAYYERVDYDHVFFDVINDDEGACDKCLEAMQLKRGALAEAKKEFGIAKRQVSCHGKRLIRGGL